MAIRFEKVSEEQYLKDYIGEFGGGSNHMPSYDDFEKDVRRQWENIKLPKRATAGSAGYDFFVPRDVYLEPGQVIKLPTGIRAIMPKILVLLLFVRSSIGFKYQTVLTNNTGIVDSDYSEGDNEGHIWIKLRNDGDKPLELKAGDAVVQGIFMPWLMTNDDWTGDVKRTGGIGSTGR